MADLNLSKKAYEDYDDAIFKIAIGNAAEKLGEDLLKENQALKEKYGGPTPEQTERFKKALRKSRNRANPKNPKKALLIASIVIIAVLAFAFSPAGKAVASRVKNLLVSPQSNSTIMQMGNDNKGIPAHWTNCYLPTYIPDEYYASSDHIFEDEDTKMLTFFNEKDSDLFISYLETFAYASLLP